MTTKGATYCFIINCASNSFKAESFFKSREDLLTRTFEKVEFVYIRQNDSIVDIVSQKAKSCTHIIACGGDGTVNRVVNGMMESKTVLGVLPLGSGNDFAQSIGLDNQFDKSLTVLKRDKRRSVDVLNIGSDYFINTFGIGVDGLTNYYASKLPFKSGILKYFFGGLKALIHSKPFEADIQIDQASVNHSRFCWMLAIANGKSEGGRYLISPDSLNHDGIVELILVKSVSRIRLIVAFIKLSFGFNFNDSLVERFQFNESCGVKTNITLKQHADGEQVSQGKELNFGVRKSAISVVVGS